MNGHHPHRSRLPELLAALFGLAWFLAIGGHRAILPTSFDWLDRDITQHVLGWLFFRREPWSLPLGRITGFCAPAGTTVGYTDANPLLALPLRLVSPLLPLDFQYVGLWLAACFALQGWFGARIAGIASDAPPFRFLGGALFALAPPLTSRIGHDTLCAHAALLAVLWLYLRPHPDAAEARRALWGASAAAWITALVHPSLAVMVAGLALALTASLALRGLVGRREAWLRGAAVVFGQALLWLACGYFTAAPTHAGGFGLFSTDLLGFVNPLGASRFLPSLHVEPGQWEGNAYLGLGGLALCLMALVLLQRLDRTSWPTWRALAPVLVVAGAMSVIALSSVITAAGHPILDLRRAYRPMIGLLGPFRASGRFIWPLYYLAVAGVVLAVPRLIRSPWKATAVMGSALALQLADLSPAVGSRFTATPWRLRDPTWRLAAPEYRELLLFPPQIAGVSSSCRGDVYDDGSYYAPFAYEAYAQGLRFNSGYVSRGAADRFDPPCRALEAEVAAGQLRADAVYVVHPGALASFQRAGATCGSLDGHAVCVAAARETRLREALARGSASPDVTAGVEATVPVTAAVAMLAPDREIQLVRDGITVVEPGASFRIEVAAPIGDGRLSLRDEQDAMVPSKGTNEVAAQWTRYRLSSEAPLRPGTSYTLHLDGAVTRELHDGSGRVLRPVVFTIRTSGERPPAPAAPKRRWWKRR